VKKSVVVVLILLAVVVLVSPALVGRLAERSMDENLNWAATESGEVMVTSERFTRGWFSSEGQHRVELRDGELLTGLQALAGPMNADDLPVLVIDTHLDHGLIPLSSMSRDRGSLAPGLGSAVSTMQVELPEGETVDVPGTIYSKVALDGSLQSHYVLDAGSRSEDGVTASWSDVDIEVTTDPASGEVVYGGEVETLAFDTGSESMSVKGLTFDGRRSPTRYGISVGDLSFRVGEFAAERGDMPTGGFGDMAVQGRTSINDGELQGDGSMIAKLHNLPQVGEMAVDLEMRLAGADAAAVGRVRRGLADMQESGDPMAVYGSVEDDLKSMFASGFEFSFDKLDVTLPQGTMRLKMLLSFGEVDPATFTWSSLLLATEASIDLSVPAALIETYAQGNPQAAMAIGGGYLVRRGDDYVMEAQLKKGLLTVNGAPIPIPLGAM
jgi:uncharacterized protein YdgA (DUF945 family)